MLNTAKLLISFDDFNDRVDVSTQMDSNDLTPVIDRTQRMYLPALICRPLYDELIAEKQTGYFSPDNEVLLDDYIKDYLVNKVWAKFILKTNIHHTPSGYMTFQGDEWGDPISDKHRAELIRDQEEAANYYEMRMVEFLENNVETYPKFKDCQCKGDRPYNQQFKISAISGKGRVTRTETLREKSRSSNRIKGGKY